MVEGPETAGQKWSKAKKLGHEMESTGNTAGWKENGEGKVRTVSLSDGKKVA